MTFTCDRCQGEYRATKDSAAAHVYIKDSRCNHVEARCAHCGTTEVIFLGPSRFEEVIRAGGVPPTIHAEAGADLRIRAEKAWAAAERSGVAGSDPQPASVAQPALDGAEGGVDALPVVQSYELTSRHEELLEAFGAALTNIPDDLLWDGLEGDHDPQHPERWTD